VREANGVLFMESQSLKVLTPGSPTNGLTLLLAPAK